MKTQVLAISRVNIQALQVCDRARHSFMFCARFQAAPTFIPLLLKATFTLSTHTNQGLPYTCLPLTSAINTFLAIGCSFILFMCPHEDHTSQRLHINIIFYFILL